MSNWRSGVRPLVSCAAFALLLGLLLLLSAFGWPASYFGAFSDGISYLYMADVLRGDEGIALLHFRHSQFPPGYPAFLALVGAGSTDPVRALMAQAGLVIVACGLLLAWYRKLLASWPAAAILAALALLLPWQLPWAFEPSSEPLFVVLLATIFLMARDGKPAATRLWLVALLVAYLCLVRTAGVPMLLALAFWAHGRGFGAARTGMALGLAALPATGWQLYKQDQLFSASYLDSLPAAWARLLDEPMAMVASQLRAWTEGLSPTIAVDGIAVLGGIGLLALALPTLWQRLRQREMDALFLALYLPAIALWPFPAEMSRLVGVSLPFLLPLATLTMLRLLPRHWKPAASADAGAIVLALLLAATSAAWARPLGRVLAAPEEPPLSAHARSLGWIVAGQPLELLESQHRTAELLRQAASLVPTGECIYSPLPALTSLHSGRLAMITPAQVFDANGEWSTRHCRWFLVSSLQTLQGGPEPLHPAGVAGQRLRPVLVSQMKAADGSPRVVAALMVRQD